MKIGQNIKSSLTYVAAGVIVGGLFLTTQANGLNIKLNPIKPSGQTKLQPITDEQQAILAVRKAKNFVVNITGQRRLTVQSTDPRIANLKPEVVFASGIIWDKEGLVVTNYHVVEDASLDYFLVMEDGTKYASKVVATDPFDDIAILKADTSRMTPAVLSNSDNLETGQSVFAIGNSLGRYRDSVTRGVISGLGRSVDEAPAEWLPTTHNWIQTDAAINPGNSGGPLVDMLGEVVGMNTLIDTGGSSLGFAVPVNTIKDAVSQYKQFGKISRPYLGLQFSTINEYIKTARGLNVDNGACVLKIAPGSPAEAAGFMPGDIITSINGQPLTIKNPLDAIVQKMQAGSQIALKYIRNGQASEKIVILGTYKN